MTSDPAQHLASYPCTAAGSRALAGHLRDDVVRTERAVRAGRRT